jgi:glycosyltransferase involved in cell wall biosynthesis
MISFVIPCYNEESNVKPMYDLVIDRCKDTKEKYEIIFVNDGSKDKTIDNLRDIVEHTRENVRVIDFSRNFGKESAIYAGLESSKGDFVALIDGDLQQDPKYVIEAVEFLKDNKYFDCVTYYQEKRKEGKFMSFVKKSFYKIVNKITDVNFVENASDFRVLRRNMVDTIVNMKEYYRFSKGIFGWIGFHSHNLPYEVKDRNSGTTKWGFKKLLHYAFDGIISFTTVPLKIATYVGSISFIISLFFIIEVIVKKLFFGIDAPGYATITILLLLLGGLQLLSLGILGEYLGRNYIETKRRPIYISREVLDSKEK